ncbi:uncharacterized protein LOC123695586 isoform X1 [Colias croceus]|uniref:uncharacterized protein LOC123695586 isoform X1 n=1 Tax=Colias crocea TaxID=72248 RepID=UPI001E2817EF|nr:uncharacterized protein LOC123695586 isoform X1 [Colias croceus]XP_045497439.1 uncharacterized protein LOC123695586 isoform X1 [Colias croceus]
MVSEGVPVDLYIYDLTNGLASVLSPTIIGRKIEGVWHTSIVVFEREYFYGASGITSCAPGSTQLGAPLQVERLGSTFVPFQVFNEYIEGLATSTYNGSAYHLLEHNCNSFSEEVAQFLCGGHVPKHIISQAERDLPAPLRMALTSMLGQLVPGGTQAVYANGVRHSRQDSPEYLTLNNQIEEARIVSQELDAKRNTIAEKVARKERKKEKKRKKLREQGGTGDDADEMAEAVEAVEPREPVSLAGPSSRDLEVEAEERRAEEQKKRSRDPPVVYRDIDGAQEFEAFAKNLEGVELSPEEKQSLDELQQYLVQGEGSWVLGDDFLSFIGRILSDPSISSSARISVLRCLAASALRDDVSLVLHQDRRQHALLGYAHGIDALPLEEQHALALFMCNLFENTSSSEWLLYISEWEHRGHALSNIRVTTKVCVQCMLSEQTELRECGTALLYNIASKEVKTVVFDEVCVELAMAALQLTQWAPAEEHLWRTMTALARLAQHSAEVPQLIAIVGPDPSAYRGTSARVDEQIDLIMKKVK